jgi:hypothetical protein
MAAKKRRSPYEPLITLVRWGAVLYVFGMVFSVLSATFGWSVHGFLDNTGESLCVQNDYLSVGIGNAGPIFKPGVAASSAATSLCVHDPTFGQQLLDLLTELPTALVYGGALVLLWWLLEGAQHAGPFSIAVSKRLRFIGLWLALGSIVAENVQLIAHNALIATMMTGDGAVSWSNSLPALPVTAILAGLGMIVVARILRVGAQMQDDLVGTV